MAAGNNKKCIYYFVLNTKLLFMHVPLFPDIVCFVLLQQTTVHALKKMSDPIRFTRYLIELAWLFLFVIK